MTIQTVALDRIELSPLNVRRAKTDIATLVASIKAHGLINPLTVTNGGDTYRVIAGGRRFAALQELGFTEAPVKIVSEDEAEELSLAENFVRQNMTMPDILRALRSIGEKATDYSSGQLAERFGIGIDRARQLLRLASLHPQVLDAYENGELDDDQARAFGSTDDTERQAEALAAWREADQWSRGAQAIKKLLGYGGDWALERMLREVGTDAYEAAGGQLEADLFGDGARIVHPELLIELHDKLEAIARQQYADRLSRPVTFIDEYPSGDYQHVYASRGALPDQDEARITTLCQQMDEMMDEDRDEDAYAALDAEVEALEDKRPIVLDVPDDIEVLARFNGHDAQFFIRRDSKPATSEGQADAPAEEKGIQLTQKAEQVLAGMRRERLIARSPIEKGNHTERLVFTLARNCFMGANSYDARGFGTVDCPAWQSKPWMQERDDAKAFAAFRKAMKGDKLEAFTAELLARMTQAKRADERSPYIDWVATASENERWQTSEDFWELFRKGHILELVGEACPEAAALLTNMKQGELREYAHDLFGERKKILWKQLTDEQRAAIEAWVPAWLRFKDEEPAP